MPTIIQEIQYFTQQEVADRLGVDRTTLWRWRRGGEVPQGRKFRGTVLLFTEAEIRQIENYAFRLEPVAEEDPDQFEFFKISGGG